MTVFGWITIFLWTAMAAAPGTNPTAARVFCLLMVIGTLVWGTGSL